MSPRCAFCLALLTALFAVGSGLPDSLHAVCDAPRVLAPSS